MLPTIGQPAYRRVADELREQIADGTLRIGSPIPSTAQLGATYSVSATVVRAAVAELRAEGLVRGQAGKGVYVVDTPEALKDQNLTLVTLADDLSDLRDRLTQLDARATSPTTVDLDELRAEVTDLRRQLGMLQAQVMNLSARVGEPYPNEVAERSTSPARTPRSRRGATA